MRSHPQASRQAPDRVPDAELLVGAVLLGVIVLLTTTLVPLFA